MFFKYFINLFQKFGAPFKGEMISLFIMSVIGGFLELLGIAMIFPVLFVLTSSETTGGQAVLNYCLKIFPNYSENEIALVLSLIMIGTFLFKNVFMIVYTKFQNDFVKKWADYVNEDVIKRLLYAPFKDTNKISYGDKNTLLYSAVRDISLDFVLRCIILFANFVVALFIIALLFYKFTLPAFLSTAFILIYAFFENSYFRKKARKYGDEGVKLLNNLALDVNFTVSSVKEIIVSNKQEYFANSLLNSTKNISENFAKRISYGNFPLFVTEIGVIISFLIMVLTILFTNDVTRGEILSSLAVIALIVLRLVPQLNKVLISMYTINVSKQKVQWFLEKYNEISKFDYTKKLNSKRIEFKDEIKLQNVSFKYETGFGIKNINLSIKKGEFIGIIGLSGAGKTTLADIISGVTLPDFGEILIDGTVLTNENVSGWQKNISILPQESVFLNDSILKNVAWGEEDSEIDYNKALIALQNAGLNPEDFDINKKPELSYGQKKRVALARAYYKDFDLLILDEATSSLDVLSEQFVCENVGKLKGEKTILAIAHRLLTLKNCDKIIWLEDGEIKAEGSFDELRNKYGDFEKMLKISSFET